MDATMEIRPKKWGFQPSLGLDKGLSDALADYARSRWPTNTAKMAAREWDLTPDEGIGITKGRASKTTIERVIKRGGEQVGLWLIAQVLGRPLRILEELETAHADHAQRLGALVRPPGSVPRPDPASDPRRNWTDRHRSDADAG